MTAHISIFIQNQYFNNQSRHVVKVLGIKVLKNQKTKEGFSEIVDFPINKKTQIYSVIFI